MVHEVAQAVRNLHDFVVLSLVCLPALGYISEGLELDVGNPGGTTLRLLLRLNLLLEFLDPLIKPFHLVLILLVFDVPLAQLRLQLLDAVVLFFNSRYLFLELVYAGRFRLFVALGLHPNRRQTLPLLSCRHLFDLFLQCRHFLDLFLHIVHG